MATVIKLPPTRWGNKLHKRRVQYPSPGGPLSREQKARICIMAREAFEQATTDDTNFTDWRRGEQLAACGKESLKEAVQSDYLPLRAHFEDLLGKSDRALETHLRAAAEPQRIAMMKLRQACTDAGLDLAYPSKICRQQYKCELDEANANQLWRLVFTVKNRKKKNLTGKPENQEQTEGDPF